jgi:protein tyrosine phosphatase (PTP) superfamily phosphohydrolase (DUF442 family)
MSAISSTNGPSQIIPNLFHEYLPSRESLQGIVDRVFKNPFFWALALTAAGGVAILASTVLLPVAAPAVALFVVSILGAAYLGQSKETKKWLFCELSMMNNQVVSRIPWLTRRPWQSPITDLISLSACPLVEQVEKLKAQGYRAVLSMVEPFEVEPHLFGIPAKPEDWQRVGIEFLNLPTPDVTPVREEDVERGVEFLHRHVSLGRRVLVHCQAGVGRSATIVVCYLIKHGGMSPSQAVAYVDAKRCISVNAHSIAIKNFVERLNQRRVA